MTTPIPAPSAPQHSNANTPNTSSWSNESKKAQAQQAMFEGAAITLMQEGLNIISQANSEYSQTAS